MESFNLEGFFVGALLGGVIMLALLRVPGFARTLLAFAAAFAVLALVDHGPDVITLFRQAAGQLRGHEAALLGAAVGKTVVAFFTTPRRWERG